MFISAIPKRAILHDGSIDKPTLIFECAPADNSGVLDIGDKYVYASKENLSFLRKRNYCELTVRINRKSSVSEKTTTEMGMSTDKIGGLGFYPPYKKDETGRSVPAFLEAFAFLDDQVFDRILGAIASGKKPEWLTFDIENKGTLTYGWEPDGSRIEWKIDNIDDPAYVDITSMAIGIELFRI